MSEQNQNALLDPESAYQYVFEEVYSPLFFEKLAGYGIPEPQDPHEKAKFFKLAERLRAAHESEQQKRAAANGSLIDMASEHLANVLGDQYDGPNEHLIEKAAFNLSQHPDLATAALTLQASASDIDVAEVYRKARQQQ